MKKIITTRLLLVVVGSLLLSGFHFNNAYATEAYFDTPRLYYGLDIGPYRLTYDDGSHLTISSFVLNAGKVIDKNFSVEGRFGMTENKNLYRYIEGDIDVFETFFSIYFRATAAQADHSFYGLLGYTRSRFEVKGLISNVETDSGLSYGLGMDLFGNRDTAVSIKLIRLLKKTEWHEDNFTIGLTHYIGR